MRDLPISAAFEGFPKNCLWFYRELAKNNSKQWFDQHRSDFESLVMKPARLFVAAMGDALARISPGIHADPRVDKSVFRIYRDVRFSKDKRPFKTNLAIWFWEGAGLRMESSGFYLQLEPDSIMLGAGMYMFPKDMLKAYRDSVVHSKYGAQLADAVRKVVKKGYELGGLSYKKVPRGYRADHANAEFLLYNGLWAGIEGPVPKELYTPDLVKYCYKRFADMYPIHGWLYAMTKRIS